MLVIFDIAVAAILAAYLWQQRQRMSRPTHIQPREATPSDSRPTQPPPPQPGPAQSLRPHFPPSTHVQPNQHSTADSYNATLRQLRANRFERNNGHENRDRYSHRSPRPRPTTSFRPTTEVHPTGPITETLPSIQSSNQAIRPLQPNPYNPLHLDRYTYELSPPPSPNSTRIPPPTRPSPTDPLAAIREICFEVHSDSRHAYRDLTGLIPSIRTNLTRSGSNCSIELSCCNDMMLHSSRPGRKCFVLSIRVPVLPSASASLGSRPSFPRLLRRVGLPQPVPLHARWW